MALAGAVARAVIPGSMTARRARGGSAAGGYAGMADSTGIVVVGTGQAAFQLATSLREEGYAAPITLVGDEPGLPYNRPPLSKAYLKGERGAVDLALRPEAFYAGRQVSVRAGVRVLSIDRAARRVALSDGTALGYAHLVLATGTRNRRLDVPGVGLAGVTSLRTQAEASALWDHVRAARRVVVVGAGFIGLEFAAVAAGMGCAVHVVEAGPRAMGRAVTPGTAATFTRWHEAQGTRFSFGTGVAAILGEGSVRGVRTTDGVEHPAELVLVGIGVEANDSLAADAGLAVANGVVVDERLGTADPAISAIGDCAAYPSRHAAGAIVRLESVQNAVDHARSLAARLAGRERPYDAVPWFWSDQGPLKLQIAGLTAGSDAHVTLGAGESCAVLCFRGGRLAGVETVNRLAEHMAARKLLQAEAEVTPEMAAAPGFGLREAAKALAG